MHVDVRSGSSLIRTSTISSFTYQPSLTLSPHPCGAPMGKICCHESDDNGGGAVAISGFLIAVVIALALLFACSQPPRRRAIVHCHYHWLQTGVRVAHKIESFPTFPFNNTLLCLSSFLSYVPCKYHHLVGLWRYITAGSKSCIVLSFLFQHASSFSSWILMSCLKSSGCVKSEGMPLTPLSHDCLVPVNNIGTWPVCWA